MGLIKSLIAISQNKLNLPALPDRFNCKSTF